MRHFSDICEPYDFIKENVNSGKTEVIRKLSDCINSEKSLMKFAKEFSSNKAPN